MHDPTALLARGIAVLWAAFWLLFFVVESLAWHTPVAVMAAWTGLGVLFLALAVIAWRSELKGGLLLVLAGLVAGLAYAVWPPEGLPAISRLMTTIAFGAPPVLAGMLFVVHHRVVSAGGEAAGPSARA